MLLLCSLHCFGAVSRPHPFNGPVGTEAAHNCEARQGGPSAAMPAYTPHLYGLPHAGLRKQRPKGGDERSAACRQAKVRPVEVCVWPRRLPLWIEVQAVVRGPIAAVGVVSIKRCGHDWSAVGQYHNIVVPVEVYLAMTVIRPQAPGRLIWAPVRPAVTAHHNCEGFHRALMLAGGILRDDRLPCT